MKKLLVLFLLLILLVTLAGCGKNSANSNNQQEVLSYADPITNNLLAGFNQNDYVMFSRDFDEQMKNALTQPVFEQTRKQITSKIGTYQSRSLTTIQQQGPNTVVIYNGTFEQESGVVITVAFQNFGDKELVSGLWFKSPKLSS